MTSEKTCFVYIVLPGTTNFVTAARFQVSLTRNGIPIGEFIYVKKYLSRPDAVELDPIELRLGQQQYQTIRMHGFFGAIRDAIPDYWGRREAEKIIDNMVETIKNEWYSCLRQSGVSERDCEIVANAFVYEGFFYGNST
jgi:hypothetical protein